MHDEIPCQVCGKLINSHMELFTEHLHRPPTEAELKSLEWQAAKQLNHTMLKSEREQRGDRWKPPLQRLVQMKFNGMFR